jgi:hypothetical protein
MVSLVFLVISKVGLLIKYDREQRSKSTGAGGAAAGAKPA